MKRYCYNVAGLHFDIYMQENIELNKFLPNFIPFYNENINEFSIFSCKIYNEDFYSNINECKLIEESESDLGTVRLYLCSNCYRVDIYYGQSNHIHHLIVDKQFEHATAYIDWTDSYAYIVIASMIRILFSQRILFYGGAMIHSSVVIKDYKGYLFLGKSGTGKSTHSRLWMEEWDNVELLNDDNPIIRLTNGKAMVFGSPWSGKTPCYKNKGVVIGGIARLKQADDNKWTMLGLFDSWVNIYPSCSIIRKDKRLFEKLIMVLNDLVVCVRIGILQCRPSREAARLCEYQLTRNID